jgi:hypothetical protein
VLGVEAVGGLYQPLRRDDLRPRGAVREDIDPDSRLYARDRLPATELRELLETLLEMASAAAEQLRAGALEPRPPTCKSRGGCSYPGICRVEAR